MPWRWSPSKMSIEYFVSLRVIWNIALSSDAEKGGAHLIGLINYFFSNPVAGRVWPFSPTVSFFLLDDDTAASFCRRHGKDARCFARSTTNTRAGLLWTASVHWYVQGTVSHFDRCLCRNIHGWRLCCLLFFRLCMPGQTCEIHEP